LDLGPVSENTSATTRPRTARAPKGPSYSIDDLRSKYPSLKSLAAPAAKASERAWVAAFTHRPEALEGILSDLIKQAYAKPGRIGQRPMPREAEVDLEALLSGEYTDEPLAVSLPKLVKISERALCTKLYISRRMYQRMFLPEHDPERYHPDAELLTRIAQAVGKQPSYFLEYRLIAAQAAFLNLITEKPVIATRIYREYLEVVRQSPVPKK
jgi:hypothetical protein